MNRLGGALKGAVYGVMAAMAAMVAGAGIALITVLVDAVAGYLAGWLFMIPDEILIPVVLVASFALAGACAGGSQATRTKHTDTTE